MVIVSLWRLLANSQLSFFTSRMGAWVGGPELWVGFRCEGRVEPSWNNAEQELDS